VRPVRDRVLVEPLLTASGSLLALGLVAAWAYDDSLRAIAEHGRTAGWESIAIGTGAALVFALGFRTAYRRTLALWMPFLLAVQLATMLLAGQYPLVVAAGLSVAASLACMVWPRPLRRLHRPTLGEMGAVSAAVGAGTVLMVYQTPDMLFRTSHTPASGLAAALAATVALLVAAASFPVLGRRHIGRLPVDKLLLVAGGAGGLWTLAAGILGAEQLAANPADHMSIHDHFQQGHVLVSVSWVLVGLTLVVASLRRPRRELRIGGIGLLFVALAKLFLYDLAFLTAMARAVSFIVTGSVLLLAALLLQRYTQGKAGMGGDPPEVAA
jgi:hypothetical protein